MTPGDGGTVLIAGAGIGGLAAALALARRGFRVEVFEKAERLEEAGAGIQLTPNATRVLIRLGLGPPLEAAAVAPLAVLIRSAGRGRETATLPLGPSAQARYGSAYWVIHRADLQRVLVDAAAAEPLIKVRLGARITGRTEDHEGVTATGIREGATFGCRGAVLIGADGLRSDVRALLGDPTAPHFRNRTAWRATLPAAGLDAQFTAPVVNLWTGPAGHLVHYPVRGGSAVNIVAVAADRQQSAGWTTASMRDDVLARFPSGRWAAQARDLLATAEVWQKWAVFDRPASRRWGSGRVSLLGDAAHPMVPYLAQGAAMAIEDAAVLAQEFARSPENPVAALRRYEGARQPRTARVQRAARRNDLVYHLAGPAALVRDAGMRMLGGRRLLAQYDWIYDWRP